MPDLAALAQIAPQYAAFLAGQEGQQSQSTNQIAQQKALDDIIQQQTMRAQQAQKFPLELDQLAAGTDERRAVTRNTNATAGGQELTNQATAATQPSTILNTNTKNNASTYATVAQHFNSLADEIDNNPNVPPAAALSQAMQNRQLPDKAIQGITQSFANVPPNQLSAKLRAMGDRVARETPQYAAEMDKEKEATRGRREVANIEATSRENVANIIGGSRVKAAEAHQHSITMEEQLMKAPNARARYSLLNDAAQKAQDAGDTSLAASYRVRAAQQEQQAQAETNGANQRPGELSVPGMATTPQLSIKPPAPAAPASLPKPVAGIEHKGYRFKGGDPTVQSNWEKLN
jgi:hypothetical protein